MKENRFSRRTPFEYGDDRARDLLKVFKREFEICDCLGMIDVLKIVVNCPSERFWVSEERALRVVSSMYRRPLPPTCNRLKREMFEEIKRRCERLLDVHPDWPLSRRVYYVVGRPAPKFYLSVSSAHTILTEYQRKCKKEQMQRLQHLIRVAS